jgi:hypothetical protein
VIPEWLAEEQDLISQYFPANRCFHWQADSLLLARKQNWKMVDFVVV